MCGLYEGFALTIHKFCVDDTYGLEEPVEPCECEIKRTSCIQSHCCLEGGEAASHQGLYRSIRLRKTYVSWAQNLRTIHSYCHDMGKTEGHNIAQITVTA